MNTGAMVWRAAVWAVLLAVLAAVLMACAPNVHSNHVASPKRVSLAALSSSPANLTVLSTPASNGTIPGSGATVIGRGYDTAAGAIRGACVVFNNTPGELVSAGSTTSNAPQSVSYRLVHVKDASEVLSALGVSASAGLGLGIFSADVAISYLHSSSFSRYSEFLLLNVSVTNQATVLKETKLTTLGEQAFVQGAEAFRRVCGESFIWGSVTGGEYTAVVRGEHTAQQSQDQVSAKFEAAVAMYSVSGDIRSASSQLSQVSRIEVTSLRKGPTDPLPGVAGMVDYAQGFPQKVASASGSPAIVYALTMDYGAVLPSLPAQTPPDLNEMGGCANKLWSRVADLQYVRAHSDDFGVTDLAAVDAEMSRAQDEVKKLTTMVGQQPTAGPYTCPTFAEMPKRIIYVPIDPTSATPAFVGRAPKGSRSKVWVRGYWSAWSTGDTWFGPGQNETMTCKDLDTGASKVVSISGVPQSVDNCDVYFVVNDSVYTDNRSKPSDGVRVALYYAPF